VLNDSRVIPARLRGVKPGTGGEVELLLVEETARNEWWAMARPGKRIRPGTRIELRDRQGKPSGITAVALGKNAEGHVHLRFEGVDDLQAALPVIGEVPLPPYIGREPGEHHPQDAERYQTVYARPGGSVAAPTAGLHFTPELLAQLRAGGVETCFVTLHVGLGTFAPVKAEHVADHVMHAERYELGEETARKVRAAKAAGRRVIAVGTTSVRVLETVAAEHGGQIKGQSGSTRIFIHPPCRFQVVDALLTNFHLPQSTLLMLVSAFAAPGETRGRELILSAYAEAVRERYRFFSYGDAMLIL
jgi:S-adenosylmethionine:tRNA ribosyltransferase-isomerase